MYTVVDMTREDRIRLIDIATEGENLDLAMREARLLLQMDPTNRKDRKLLADILAWRGDFSESIALYEQLLKSEPKNIDLQIQVADIWNWWRDYPESLIRYSRLLSIRPGDVYLGFIDAASSTPSLSANEARQAFEIYQKYKDEIKDTARMARLAWVLIRTNHGDEADELLNRALALKPTDPEVRKELAGALAGRDRIEEAIALFASVESDLNFSERITYAVLLTAGGTRDNLREAERQFRRLIALNPHPKDAEIRVRFAEMLMWSGKYDKQRYSEALREFESLAADYPKDIRFPIRIAQVLLFSGRYAQSLPRFQSLLDNELITEKKLERDVWMGFVDSVAGEVGEVLRKAGLEDEAPDRYLAAFFNEKLRRSIGKAYARSLAVKPMLPERPTEKYLSEMRYYCESLARLGLGLALMGERERSREVFEQAIGYNRSDREIWQQYAKALTLTKEYIRARAIYEPLIAGRIPEAFPR